MRVEVDARCLLPLTPVWSVYWNKPSNSTPVSITYHSYGTRSGAKYWTIVQYLLLFFTIFEVLEGLIHGGNELETSNCN
jgi:hypothetical protein